jgi:hypothetical protein
MVTVEAARGALQTVLARAVADGPRGAMLYMVLDAAHDPMIYERLSEFGDAIETRSLYQGDIGASLAHVSPYLLRLRAADDAAWFFATAGLGRSWGVFLVATAAFEEVRRHLRKFNIVFREDASPLVFRFHDPRVLSQFLPTCTADELRRFFGPIDSFLMETAGADTLLRFTLRDGQLLQSRLPLSA